MENTRRDLMKVRVLVADSSRIHTQLLSDILERDPDLELIGWDCNRSTLIATSVAHKVDVLAVSSRMNGRTREGLDVVREICAVHPGTKVVVLVDSQDDDLVLDSLRAGAKGIFSKEGSLDMLRKCLHSVHRGEIWVDGRGMSLVINALASTSDTPVVKAKKLENLSKRECEVVEWLVQGLSNREISTRMKLSQHTVKNYIFRIFDKMGVSSRVELLFLVLTQNNGDGILSQNKGDAAALFRKGRPSDDREISALIEEAERGSATAQLSLAQAYAGTGNNPQKVHDAYKWYCVVSERIAQAQSILIKNMTTEEIEECEREAKFFLARMKHASESVSAKKVPARKSLLIG